MINKAELRAIRGQMMSTMYEVEWLTKTVSVSVGATEPFGKVSDIETVGRRFERSYGVTLEQFDAWIEEAPNG
jgi:hypothetical protein